MQQEVYKDVVRNIRAALGALELDKSLSLYQDSLTICEALENPVFRIAVFGPFNYGKSTLLNALLGQRTLPIDLIPTTGAAIHVRYGEELSAKITLNDGQVMSDRGTTILKQYAILDQDRRMRNDVAVVEVFCPHSFLKIGVEFLDLPGTNDREEQDNLVRNQLLTADLVVQVLDARKLMTLGERENLRDWLLDRGIETVVFAVNFMNLMEPEDQKEVSSRMRFVAESFRSNLPPGISNLYRVDALPALRARLKGDAAAAQVTGLPMFESALQSIVAFHQEKTANWLPRLEAIAAQICDSLAAKLQGVTTDLALAEEKQSNKIQLQQKAEKLIKQGFEGSVSDLQSKLYLPNLLKRYELEAIAALQKGQFRTWETQSFQPAMVKSQQEITTWVNKACEFFNHPHPGTLTLKFPDPPSVTVPPTPPTPKSPKHPPTILKETPLDWLLESPVGNTVARSAYYILNRISEPTLSTPATPVNPPDLQTLYKKAVEDYLKRFSEMAFLTLQDYENIALSVIRFQPPDSSSEMITKRHQIQLLQNILDGLNQDLQSLKGT
ncbi:dynamin family protein [Laspinema olomoucense]|uniref:dynamin family protein n=1 Tax=Laspinema olomoucense TaxID=3231600 RepID=UPI0021BAD9BF|nr:dynamin family protein [Laspinema sp. D3c]MCT7995461.1 dynamin family protein [Laspinema sp. D3c]